MANRSLLICTQTVDQTDPVLGFFHEWIRELALRAEHVSVICLSKGHVSLPSNVTVYSLGKETRPSRIRYVLNFYRALVRFQGAYDGVFVHMNPEYVVLGGLMWRLLKKKVVLWYNHTSGGMLTNIAMALADTICHTSPYAYTAGTKKSKRMPAGIDTTLFSKIEDSTPRSILFLGRIAPVKGVKELIEAALILERKGERFSLDIYGNASSEDAAYKDMLQDIGKPLVEHGVLHFYPAVEKSKAPEIFARHEIFVNLTPRGNYDKTVLEAAASGSLPVVSSPAFADLIDTRLFFKEQSPESLALTLQNTFSLSQEAKQDIRLKLKRRVKEEHALEKLAEHIIALF